MAAINNLFPLAQALRLSLVPYKSQLELNNSFRPGQAIDPFLGVVDFISGVHAKEMFISDPPKRGSGSQPNGGWNYRTVNGNNVLSPYFANRGSRVFQLGNVVSTTPDEWVQLQGTIFGIYEMLDPLAILYSGAFTAEEMKFWSENMGLIFAPRLLTGADGKVLQQQISPDALAYATAWNTIKVPHDRALGYNTPYVFGLQRLPKIVGDGWAVRSIGNIPVDQQAAIDYWNFYYPTVVSR